MMDPGDNKLDDLFRKSLGEEDVEFDEAHWRDMKKKLEQDGERRRDIFLWAAIGGAAAMLIMAAALWFTQPSSIVPIKVSVLKPQIRKQAPANIEKPIEVEKPILNVGAAKSRSYERISYTVSTKIGSAPSEKPNIDNSLPETVLGSSEKATNVAATTSNALPNSNDFAPQQKNAADQKDIVVLLATDTSRKVAEKKSYGFRPSVILSVTAAPDINAVNSFSTAKRGLGGGLLATVTLSPVLSLTTGVQLAKKLYQTEFSNYRPVTNYIFHVTPSIVEADCRVLDIPLNLNYTFRTRRNYKIALSAGASSYFMINENYDFEYSYKKPGTWYPSHYQIRNSNNHIMGVGNIAVSYERKLNKNSAVAIQPFIKLPLTEIGFGNVNLMSTGVSASFNVNLSEVTGRKP